jgi:uncharacterized membrane protein
MVDSCEFQKSPLFASTNKIYNSGYLSQKDQKRKKRKKNDKRTKFTIITISHGTGAQKCKKKEHSAQLGCRPP